MNESNTNSLNGITAMGATGLLVGLLVYAYIGFLLMMIANKTRTPGAWMAWVPFANLFLMCRIAGKPAWWFLLMLIPFVNFIVLVMVWMEIAQARGKSAWLGVLMIVPGINLLVPLILAIGPGSTSGPAPAPAPTTPRSSSGPPVCRQCGQKGEPGEAFCGNCGAPFQATPAPATATSKRPSVGLWVIAAVTIVALAAGGYYFGPKLKAITGAGSNPTAANPQSYPAEPSAVTPTAQTIPPGSPGDAGRQPAEPPPEPSAGNPPSPPVPEVPPTPPENGGPSALSPLKDVIFSDSFNRPDADQWSLGTSDLVLGGTAPVSYLPLAGGDNAIGAVIRDGALENNGLDYGGIQFSSSLQGRGINIGEDMNIRVDLYVPTDAAGNTTQAGPYFRSRAAAAGDGIFGGTSAGYWVALDSNGEITVSALNAPPGMSRLLAQSGKPGGFDAAQFHTLEIAVQGQKLEVALDGHLLVTAQRGLNTAVIQLHPLWNGPPAVGVDQGTAGLWFGAEKNRGKIGGQRARNLVVARCQSLSNLPKQQNFLPPPP